MIDLTGLFYGFKPPLKNDVVFKVKGDLEQIRLFDFAVREMLPGAVQSTIFSGIRHYWAEFIHWLTGVCGSFVSWLQRYKLLRPIGWLCKLPLILMIFISALAQKADYTKRRFVKDIAGNYTFMSRSVAMEHTARAFASQLNVTIVSEQFPKGFSRNSKPELKGTATFSFTTVTGKSVVLNLY